MSDVRMRDVVALLGDLVETVLGDPDRRISRAGAIDDAPDRTTLTFYNRTGRLGTGCGAGGIFCRAPALPDVLDPRTTYVCTEHPRLAMIRTTRAFFTQPAAAARGVHASAIVDPRARIARSAFVGPLARIGNCAIGEESVISSGAHLYDGTQIGKRVTVDSGAVIGAEGFGYERAASGQLERFPHVGAVVIEDDVEIGANATIDRGALGQTRIGRGTKIDNLAYIGHNVRIGTDTMIMAHAVVCGSVRIGDRCHIAPAAAIREGVRIGNDVTVGMGSLVLDDVADGETVFGIPAKTRSGS